MNEEEDKKMLEEIMKAGGLSEDTSAEDNSVGKDMHLMMKEFTDDKNIYRLTTLKENEVPDRTMQLVMAESKGFPKKGGRFAVMESWSRNECVLRQSVVTRKNTNLVNLLKDFGGYMLAFRGGVEWRQAGIAGGDMMMDEQKKGMLSKLKQG